MTSATASRLALERQQLLIERTESLEAREVEDRLGDLLQTCERSLTLPENDEPDDPHTLLDLDYRGHRYLLIRMPSRSLRPGLALSPREQEIGRMVAKGYPNKAIAAVLEISSWTVCTHLRRMFAKFGVSSRAAMVAKLIEEGVLHEAPAGNRS